MKRFILHGELENLFSREIYLDVNTINEALIGLTSNFPSFKKYFISKIESGVTFNFIDIDDNNYELFCGHVLLNKDTYNIIAQPQGHSALSSLGGMAGGFAMNFGASFLMQKLADQLGDTTEDDGTPEYEIIETNSYIYTDNENRVDQGSPIPIVYGQLRVGTKVIHSSIDNHDFNYKESKIYNLPAITSSDGNITKVFSNNLPFDDYRSVTSYDQVGGYRVSDKRILKYGGSNNSKKFDPNTNNESFTEGYAGGYWAGERKLYGPSVGKLLRKRANQSTVPETSNGRPYLFPPAASLDGLMRPQAGNDLCVEFRGPDHVSQSLAFLNEGQNPMIVGNRGNFQKLESISMYKTLEILSEGPIQGLALPIDGLKRDNGLSIFPMIEEEDSPMNFLAKLNPLAYKEYPAGVDYTLADKLNPNTEGDLGVLEAGSKYKDTSLNLLNGTYTVTSNSAESENEDHNLSLIIADPISSNKASVEHAQFVFDSTSNVGSLISENRIFKIDADGVLTINQELETGAGGIPEKYRDGDYIKLKALSDEPLFRFSDVEEESLDEIFYYEGEGYESRSKIYEIHPRSNDIEFNFNFGYLRQQEVWFSKARIADLGSLMGLEDPDVSYSVGQNNQDGVQALYAGQTSSFETLVEGKIEEVHKSNGTVYNDFERNPVRYDRMCRIYLDAPNELSNATKTFDKYRNDYIFVKVGDLKRIDGDPFRPNISLFPNFTRVGPTSGDSLVYSIPLYWKITLSEYVSCNLNDSCYGFENWYIDKHIRGVLTKEPISSGSNPYFHRKVITPERDLATEWSRYEPVTIANPTTFVFNNSDGKNPLGPLYQRRSSDQTPDPNPANYPIFDMRSSYLRGESVKILQPNGNPFVEIVDDELVEHVNYKQEGGWDPPVYRFIKDYIARPTAEEWSPKIFYAQNQVALYVPPFWHGDSDRAVFWRSSTQSIAIARLEKELPDSTALNSTSFFKRDFDQNDQVWVTDDTHYYQATRDIEYFDPSKLNEWSEGNLYSEGMAVKRTTGSTFTIVSVYIATKNINSDNADERPEISDSWERYDLSKLLPGSTTYNSNGLAVKSSVPWRKYRVLTPDNSNSWTEYKYTECHPIDFYRKELSDQFEYTISDCVPFVMAEVPMKNTPPPYTLNSWDFFREFKKGDYVEYNFIAYKVKQDLVNPLAKALVLNEKFAQGPPSMVEPELGYEIFKYTTLREDDSTEASTDDDLWPDSSIQHKYKPVYYTDPNDYPEWQSSINYKGYYYTRYYYSLTWTTDPATGKQVLSSIKRTARMESQYMLSKNGMQYHTLKVNKSYVCVHYNNKVYRLKDGVSVGPIDDLEKSSNKRLRSVNDSLFMDDSGEPIIPHFEESLIALDHLRLESAYRTRSKVEKRQLETDEFQYIDTDGNVQTYEGVVTNYVEDYPTPDKDPSKWEEIVGHALPIEEAGQELFEEEQDWKPAQTVRDEPAFSSGDYYINYLYKNSRSGIFTGADPTPAQATEGGFFGSVMSFLFGGEIKFIRQSNSHTINWENDAWSNIAANRSSSTGEPFGLGDFIQEVFTTQSGYYELLIDGGLFGDDEFQYQIVHNRRVYHNLGEIFNEAIHKEFKNHAVSEIGDLFRNLDLWHTKEPRIPNSRTSGPHVGSDQYTTLQSEGYITLRTRHLKYNIGIGGRHAPFFDGLSTYASFDYGNLDDPELSFPAYMLQSHEYDAARGGWHGPKLKSFKNHQFLNVGYNPLDSSQYKTGFYDDAFWPRITVFVLRQRKDGAVHILPTTITGIAKVNGTIGIIEDIYLLSAPDKCVYDVQYGGWGYISPTTELRKSASAAMSTQNFRDIGVYVQIDGSHGYSNISFINTELDGGDSQTYKISEAFHLRGLATSWQQHITRDGVSTNKSFGMYKTGDTANLISYSSKSINSKISVIAEEGLDITKGIDWNDSLPSSVNTGRMKAFHVIDGGTGYPEIVSLIVLANRKIPRTIGTTEVENGFKPNTSFLIYGLPKSKFDSLSADDAVRFVTFKALIHIGDRGKVENPTLNTDAVTGGNGIVLLNPGRGYEGNNDDVVLLSTYYHSDFSDADKQKILDIINSSKLNPIIKQSNFSHLLEQDLGFPKEPMLIESVIQNTYVEKFKMQRPGLGFNKYETIYDFFRGINNTKLTVFLTFNKGSLVEATLDLSKPVLNYSLADEYVELILPPPVLTGEDMADNTPDADPYSKFRSIYLDDIPIRDHTHRFNFSKFHFDMRVGHYVNSSRRYPIAGIVLPEADDSLISEEFRIPSYTHFVNHPLFAPRNEGEKDYFYSYTIKNPQVTDMKFSIKINQLHYIYEGDESVVYMNLIPIIGMILGWVVGKWMAEKLLDLMPDLTFGFGIGAVSGWTVPWVRGLIEGAANALTYLAIITGGVLGAMAGANIAKRFFSCKSLPWLCIKIGEVIKNSGEIWPAMVRFTIEHGAEGETLSKSSVVFRGCATTAYVKDVYLYNLDPAIAENSKTNISRNRIFRIYRTTRELDPLVGGLAEARFKIDAELLSVTEFIGGFFSYPGTALVATRFNSKDFPSAPKREYIIKGKMVKIPDGYNPDDGTYYNDEPWAGTFKRKLDWTSNPAWVIYDLLTNEKYGMGKYGVKDSDINKWSFYDFARKCDERVATIVDGVSTFERRHMCNIYVESEEESWNWVKKLMKIYNTSLNFSQGRITIVHDGPSLNGPLMLFNNSNILEDGFTYTSTPATKKVTAITVDYLDERDNYSPKTEYIEDSFGIRLYGYSHARIPGHGITRQGEAFRLGWHKLLTREVERELVSFKTGLKGSYLSVGDVIEIIDNNKQSKHAGGRILKIINNDTVEIDIPVEALSGNIYLYIEVNEHEYEDWVANKTYDKLDIVFYNDLHYSLKGFNTNNSPNVDPTNWSPIYNFKEKKFAQYRIANMTGFTVEFTEDIAHRIEPGFSWMLYHNIDEKIKPKEYRIKNIKELSPLEYEIIATDYDANKYLQIDKLSSSSQLGGVIEFEPSKYYGHEIIISPPATRTPTPSITLTPSITPTISITSTETPTQTPTQTLTQTPTQTPTLTPTISITSTETPTQTPTKTPTLTPTISITPTETTSLTPTISITSTATTSLTPTPTFTETPTLTPTISITPTETATLTPTISITSTLTASLTPTISLTPTKTPTISLTPTTTPTISLTASQTPTETPTHTPTISITPSITPTISVTPSITSTISVTPSITPTISVTSSITPTISVTSSITPTISVTPSITPTISVTPSITPTISVTSSITPTISITPSITPTITDTPTTTPTVTPTPTLTHTPTVTPLLYHRLASYQSMVSIPEGNVQEVPVVRLANGLIEDELFLIQHNDIQGDTFWTGPLDLHYTIRAPINPYPAQESPEALDTEILDEFAAQADIDFVSKSDILHFNAGQLTGFISIETLSDSLIENPEIVKIEFDIHKTVLENNIGGWYGPTGIYAAIVNPSATPTPTLTPTQTPTQTTTPTNTTTPTTTPTPSETPTSTPTISFTPTISVTRTPEPSTTQPLASMTPSFSILPTRTISMTPKPTETPTATLTPTPTLTPTITVTPVFELLPFFNKSFYYHRENLVFSDDFKILRPMNANNYTGEAIGKLFINRYTGLDWAGDYVGIDYQAEIDEEVFFLRAPLTTPDIMMSTETTNKQSFLPFRFEHGQAEASVDRSFIMAAIDSEFEGIEFYSLVIPYGELESVGAQISPDQTVIKSTVILEDQSNSDLFYPVPSLTPTPTATLTPTQTPTNTPTISVTPSVSPTISVTPSITPTISITPSITPTISVTPSITPTISVTSSITPTISVTPSITPTATISQTPSETPTQTPTLTPTPSITPMLEGDYIDVAISFSNYIVEGPLGEQTVQPKIRYQIKPDVNILTRPDSSVTGIDIEDNVNGQGITIFSNFPNSIITELVDVHDRSISLNFKTENRPNHNFLGWNFQCEESSSDDPSPKDACIDLIEENSQSPSIAQSTWDSDCRTFTSNSPCFEEFSFNVEYDVGKWETYAEWWENQNNV